MRESSQSKAFRGIRELWEGQILMRDILEAIEVAYNHGYKPAHGPIDEYGEVVTVLGREPTHEEAALLGEARTEGFKKRMTENFRANRRITG